MTGTFWPTLMNKLLYLLANIGPGYDSVFEQGLTYATLWRGHPRTQGVDVPEDIFSGMQHQMDLMENTFLLFRVFALSFSILQHRALVHTYDPVPSISPALPITLPYAHTPPNFPFVCFCGMFAFLSLLSQCVLGGSMLTQLLCIYSIVVFCFFLKKKGNAQIWVIYLNSDFFKKQFSLSWLCKSVHEDTHAFVWGICPWSVCSTCWCAETELKCATC